MPIDRLIAALSDLNADTRARVAGQLAQIGADTQPAVIALVRAAGDEAGSGAAMGHIGPAEIGPPATSDAEQLAALVEDQSPDVGYWAASLLGRLTADAASVVADLARAVGGGNSVSVRQRPPGRWGKPGVQ